MYMNPSLLVDRMRHTTYKRTIPIALQQYNTGNIFMGISSEVKREIDGWEGREGSGGFITYFQQFHNSTYIKLALFLRMGQEQMTSSKAVYAPHYFITSKI